MRELKIILGLFCITLVMSFVGVNASSYQTYSNITLQRLCGVYTTGYVNKLTISHQYMKETNAVDDASGDNRVILAKIKDVSDSWVTLVKGSKVRLHPGSSNIGTCTGDYKLQLKAKKSTLSTVSFWGTWYLDN